MKYDFEKMPRNISLRCKAMFTRKKDNEILLFEHSKGYREYTNDEKNY